MIQYYVVVRPPRFTLARPLALFRVIGHDKETRAERVGENGEWVEDRSLLEDVWGLGGASGASKISEDQARDILGKLSVVEDADKLVAKDPAKV